MSKNILFTLTGSISCYKACEAISLLLKEGFTVQTVASEAALKFIGEATLEGLTGRRVHTHTFEPGHMMSHINLARWADLIVICPASAKTINNLAHGTLEGLIGEIYLANNFRKPFMIAPSMNSDMLAHPTTQENISKLQRLGVHILDTDHGPLACGEVGWGRLLSPQSIVQTIKNYFPSNSIEKGMDL